jgi:pimeloyl-ACP methyl ester carboxylesterase
MGVVDMHAIHLPGDRAFLRYLDIPGDDPPLLWIHGWQCSSTGELLPAAVQPALRGRRSLLIDLLGHGYSDKPADFPYILEAHARTVVALIDALAIPECGLVGHSMGGGIAVHVAAARPAQVSLLVLAEAHLGPEDHELFGSPSEAAFVASGFADLLVAQTADAQAAPDGIRAMHLEMTRLIEPRALYREDVSMAADTTPPIRELLAALTIPRWYLNGEWSDADGLEADLATIGVGWRIVPDAGHPMALQNPAGFAQIVAELLPAAWATSTRYADDHRQ